MFKQMQASTPQYQAPQFPDFPPAPQFDAPNFPPAPGFQAMPASFEAPQMPGYKSHEEVIKEMESRRAEMQKEMDARRAQMEKEMEARRAQMEKEMEARRAEMDARRAQFTHGQKNIWLFTKSGG